MQQVYHKNAFTNIHIRSQIQKDKSSTNVFLASQFGVSENTISKWRNRDFQTDASSTPQNIKYALTEIEVALAVSIRKSTWLPLDEIHDMLFKTNPEISRSSIYRCFKKNEINNPPTEQKEKAKKFKEYSPGYLHIDVTYLPKFNKQSYYLFVAIDRATRSMFYWVYEQKTAENTSDFMDRCLEYYPFEITHILTDNGLEFTNRLLKSKKGEPCKKLSKMDEKCLENDIEHRLTKPFTPKTNGMVERVNGIIKNNTILANKYANIEEMKNDVFGFLIRYNLYRRHGSLKKELKVRTPFEAIEKWYELDPNLFKETPEQFKIKILNLNKNIINSPQ